MLPVSYAMLPTNTAAITRIARSILDALLVNFVRSACPRPIFDTIPSLAAIDCMMITEMTDRSIAHRSV